MFATKSANSDEKKTLEPQEVFRICCSILVLKMNEHYFVTYDTGIFTLINLKDNYTAVSVNFSINNEANVGYYDVLVYSDGEIIGEDNCKCGLTGKYFLVHGRAKEAEVRGCSDVR